MEKHDKERVTAYYSRTNYINKDRDRDRRYRKFVLNEKRNDLVLSGEPNKYKTNNETVPSSYYTKVWYYILSKTKKKKVWYNTAQR